MTYFGIIGLWGRCQVFPCKKAQVQVNSGVTAAKAEVEQPVFIECSKFEVIKFVTVSDLISHHESLVETSCGFRKSHSRENKQKTTSELLQVSMANITANSCL